MESVKLTYQNWECTISLRDNLKRYPNCPFAVLYTKLTPKGKYIPVKILKNVVYKSLEDATKAAETWINTIKGNIQSDQERKQKQRAANKEVKASDFYKIGDIVYNSWGWEQTNIDFYQVIEITNKTITVKEIMQSYVENSGLSHGMACDVIACKDQFRSNGEQYKMIVRAEGKLSQPKSWYYFTKWDGKPKYKSWYA